MESEKRYKKKHLQRVSMMQAFLFNGGEMDKIWIMVPGWKLCLMLLYQ